MLTEPYIFAIGGAAGAAIVCGGLLALQAIWYREAWHHRQVLTEWLAYRARLFEALSSEGGVLFEHNQTVWFRDRFTEPLEHFEARHKITRKPLP